jgi:hypothetical protein
MAILPQRRVHRWLAPIAGMGLAALALGAAIGSTGPAGERTVASHSSAVLVATSLAVKVTWNGQNVSQASTISSAFSVTSGEQALVHFVYTESAGGPSIATAEVQTVFLSAVLSSEAAQTSPSAGGLGGTASMNWTFGLFADLTAGVYQLTARLLDPNGSSVWSESFYIDAKAPYLIGAALPALLVVLAISEVYWLVTVLRSRPRVRRLKGWEPPAGASGAPTTEQPQGSAAGASSPPSAVEGKIP